MAQPKALLGYISTIISFIRRKKIIKTILAEPYLHFLFMGLILYFYYQNFHTPPAFINKQSITITTTEIQDINHTISNQWKRNLQPSELELMIDTKYFNEILLYEAVSLKLERKDKEILKKLITQMRQILTPSLKEPSEELLHSYYQKHTKEYSITSKISFAHIYLQNLAEGDTKQFVEMLNLKAIEPQNALKYGDKFIQGNQITSVTQSQLAKNFGKYFAGRVWRLKGQKWHGVIHSRYGYHILFITHKQNGELLSFDTVEDRVYDDYIQEQRDNALQSAYKKFSTQYKLERN